MFVKGKPPSYEDATPSVIALGAAIIVEGVIGGVVMMGFTSIVENLAAIRRDLATTRILTDKTNGTL
jgi:hypothetical protein